MVPVVLLVSPLVLGGCAQLSGLGRGAGDSLAEQEVAVLRPDDATLRPVARPGGGAVAAGLGRAGLRAEALDQTSAEERAAALAPPAARTQLLGETLASLGSPAEPGLWLRTGLVTRVTQGRIEPADGSGSLRVELRPSGAVAGSGSQLSLSGFTTLGLPLTQLVSLRVYAE
ncbi:MAG: D-galactarate dehydratase [Natronohydrobacter sp.]|nr:D-galactarate dehydratase [Natronohydrobacter sp.]